MLTNYLKTAWRNITKNKFFSAINIFGLSIALACCILMYLFIQNELSYDRFHQHASYIYRLTSIGEGTSGRVHLAVTPAPWAPTMKKDFPDIQHYVRILKDEKSSVGEKNKTRFNETRLIYGDSTFFDVFSFPLETGDPHLALKAPNSIVLTASAAKKYFGESNPIGKTLEINSFGRTFDVQVTAIVKSVPSNSHLQFNALVSLQTLGDLSNMWSFHMFHSYLLLNSNTSANSLEKKFADFTSKYIANNPQADGKHDIFLQPLTDIHLRSQMIGELEANGDITYVYVFTGIAMFILLIACFNFTNLSTARSLTRAKEVGLRKVAGAFKQQLIQQFLSETALVAFLSLLIAIGLAYLALPLFNELSGRVLSLELARNFSLLLLFTGLILFVGLIAGIYPSLVLSAFKPVEVLKGKFHKSSKGAAFRKTLVGLQFMVSIALIASTIVVSQQLNFLKNKKLGFNKENVMIVTLPRSIDSTNLATYKNRLLQNAQVSSVAAAYSVPGTNIPINMVNHGKSDLSEAISMQMLFTDLDFIRTMNMKLVAGRDFSNEIATDRSSAFVLNEEAARKFGWSTPQDAVGKTFEWVTPGEVLKSGQVIGVVENFNITPLKSAVQPLVMHYVPNRFQFLYIRFNQANNHEVVKTVESKFKALFPNQTFEYNYLDTTLNALYAREANLSRIFTYFSFLAIIIGCLGILGLSLYSIQQRVKEIGIRKVLGASVPGLSAQLVKEFLKPVVIAAVVATPITWYAMNKWLEEFAYRIHISAWVFVATSLMVLLISILTMSVQTIKAAKSNPVKSLRSE